MKDNTLKWIITFVLLGLGTISPNLFVAAQEGIAPFSSLAVQYLIPSVALIVLLVIACRLLQFTELFRLARNGIWAGILATVALEGFREAGFRSGMMPGDLPRLMGVLLLNQFSSGPDIWSDLAGWAYHFGNGAAFGLMFSLVLGQSRIWQGLLYGLLIGLLFMISPVVKSLGIGFFGTEFKDGYQFALTVTMAHAAFGFAISILLKKWNKGIPNIWLRWKISSRKISPKWAGNE